ncbi:hypothetical protein [Agrobacterium sp.]|uniref:hypothetical protein n=1 Tax=Agrobacterium sp. TaxID=361 RepID=UPI0025C3C3F9|nr:hypothetical protein [Agrobacterium sp.]MCD4663405.1 hypothetical protein [Agrobacterium sp.]
MTRVPCVSCPSQYGFYCDSPTTARCDACNRCWNVEWVKRLGINMPKLTLTDDGDDHFESIGAISRQVIASSTVVKRHFAQMAGLQALNDKIRSGA